MAAFFVSDYLSCSQSDSDLRISLGREPGDQAVDCPGLME